MSPIMRIALLGKLLCLLFLHEFYTIAETSTTLTIACKRCPGIWEVDLEQHTMEPLPEGAHG